MECHEAAPESLIPRARKSLLDWANEGEAPVRCGSFRIETGFSDWFDVDQIDAGLVGVRFHRRESTIYDLFLRSIATAFRRAQEVDPDAVAAEMLKDVKGVDAVFTARDDDGWRIYVLARQHGEVDREALIDIEDKLADRYGDVEIRVRAHQGRDVNTILPGLDQLL